MRLPCWAVLVAGMAVMSPSLAATAETVKLHAAGSLKAAMTEIATAFQASTGGSHKVETVFGASGLLREKIEAGEAAHVFASADLGHPRKLADAGRTMGPAVTFARNSLCALVRGGRAVTTASLLDAMLAGETRLGMSTPKADPSGDYALALFAKAEAVKTGAKSALEAKAMQLTGGPTSPKAPEGRNLYAWVMAEDKADIFLTYCTNAILARAEVPALTMVAVPPALEVSAEYGMVVLKDAPAAAVALADFIRTGGGRPILERYGFGAP
jgi:ABC-type molybdate transport system substrate-binding protein